MSAEKIRWEGEETCEIVDILESLDFWGHLPDDGDRYGSYTKEIEIDGHMKEIAIKLDFDPYMHIDETDDEICYDYPVYVYIDRCLEWFLYGCDDIYAKDLEHLQEVIEELEKSYYDNDED